MALGFKLSAKAVGTRPNCASNVYPRWIIGVLVASVLDNLTGIDRGIIRILHPALSCASPPVKVEHRIAART